MKEKNPDQDSADPFRPTKKPSRHRRRPGSEKRRSAQLLRDTAGGVGACPITGKVQMTRERAEASAAISRERYSENHSVFRCDCGWWHIGKLLARHKNSRGKERRPDRKRIRPKPLTPTEDLPPELRPKTRPGDKP